MSAIPLMVQIDRYNYLLLQNLLLSLFMGNLTKIFDDGYTLVTGTCSFPVDIVSWNIEVLSAGLALV